ncbi:SDR family NAD(P)-dependent oxidoreductase [Phenylobacterium montanum]|uniref:SDR family NAD(P)-dependent oxidoreductase n=1 Tax=Phenylobacterium montanum TaxID=2823693 RepID=A0A975IXC6_9CAUL|nr:SDR family NAD(P)-dependent oxidoreductase [Caulobacter sp. S6]QUD90494.1 SDR family NAD(P)-dependent oxidoreductase [Caulobacter sp. S6]
MKPLALVTGVGPGTGSATVRRFVAGGYRVAMLARSAERLEGLAAELPDTIPVPCDVADPAGLAAALDALEAEHGKPKVVVHNAVGGAFGNFLQIEPEVLEANFQVNVMALLRLARRYADELAAANGALVVTGNTSAQRGKAHFAGFAPTKAAQRILAESIAREMGPKGLHVAYLVIDAVIDVPWTRQRMPDKPDDFFIKPAAIAEEVFHLAHQDRSAWSFLAEVRPFGETW